ncbi:porphobilinogen deaminase [Choiromyces venosus 120613-1]|uniref:Porphobilinogen deaminase n=1 Tax=Choiromyces venosus 120613-1 TaxID=1336337 RepID=A0A3N4JWL4_9PEZI|nr:porphobilinogen deaminase [Choiromyces venosus 120613-1]
MSSYVLAQIYQLILNFVGGSGPAYPTRRKIRIGSRKSKLALVQTHLVRDALQAVYPDIDFEIIAMTTTGDNNQLKPLHSFGAKALWTQELEVLLLEDKLEMIVHSLKDMPTQLPHGCKIGAILEREDPRDALVMKSNSPYKSLDDLPAGSVIGTSSVRRSAQIKKRYPHLSFEDVRGNVGTRLSKLDDLTSPYACLILAAAGLLRLDLGERITTHLSSPQLLHAVGQGALGVEIRDDDTKTAKLLEALGHKETTLQCLAERSLMRTLEGGCSVPIGVETETETDGRMLLRATVVSIDGQQSVDVEERMEVPDEDAADQFGRVVAGKLVAEGAGEILKAINLNRDLVDA